MTEHFRVVRRNVGHWDIVGADGRLFRIRGGPGSWILFDERPGMDHVGRMFKSQEAAMCCACSDLMFELIVAEGQQPAVIESWNVT